ncbi:MAG: hypothetical protein A2Y56_00485 [Candidatus Aminicenantes bacterium RBG_13_63_10]|nr:MAG: hypothetical protein A2Y56_00485 [Candidatus Aminicenantes bacterium RBG_13_63_10]
MWSTRHEDRIEISRQSLEENPNVLWKAAVPVARRLAKGRYQVYLRLENRSGGQSLDKLLSLKM